MSLASAKSDLQQAIESAFNAQLEEASAAASNEDVSPEDLITKLAEALTNAIHDYVLSAEVVTAPTTFETTVATSGGAGTGNGSINTASGNLA